MEGPSFDRKMTPLSSRAMARRALILALVALTVAPAAGFKFMQNWKVPTLDRMASQKQAQDKFGDKKLVVITGTSSGLGRKTAKALLRTGQYHVVGAVRDLDKMEVVAEEDEFDPESFTPMQIELNNFTSVNDFVERLMLFKAAKPVDRLILNAGVSSSSPPPFPRLIPACNPGPRSCVPQRARTHSPFPLSPTAPPHPLSDPRGGTSLPILASVPSPGPAGGLALCLLRVL